MERIIKNKTKTCASQVQGTKRSLKFVYPGHGSFPLCEKFRKFKCKWKIPFRFLLTGIIVITSGGVPLISVRINILTETRRSFFDKLVPIDWPQEPITRSLQLPHIPVTAFSQTDLFLVWIHLEFRSPQGPQWPIALKTLTCRHDVDMFTWGRIVLSSPKRANVDWNCPISRENI